MKNNITNILEKAIGNDKLIAFKIDAGYYQGYNKALQDFRAKIPAIQEAIVEEMKIYMNAYIDEVVEDEHFNRSYLKAHMSNFINHLTK